MLQTKNIRFCLYKTSYVLYNFLILLVQCRLITQPHKYQSLSATICKVIKRHPNKEKFYRRVKTMMDLGRLINDHKTGFPRVYAHDGVEVGNKAPQVAQRMIYPVTFPENELYQLAQLNRC